MEVNNLLTKGTEIYMKCLYALQQQNSTNNSANSANMTYYCPQYTHTQINHPIMYTPNHFLPQVDSQLSCLPPSAFKPVNMWPYEQYSPLNSYLNHTQIMAENGYFNRYDGNMKFETQMPTNKISSTISMPNSDMNWNLQRHIEEFSGVPVSVAYKNASSSDANEIPKIQSDVKTESSISYAEASLKTEQTSLPDIEKQMKKIRRPMNSFMIYAQRHRTKVHELYPQCDNRTVSKILSETWYALDADKKQKYNDLADEIRKDHFRLNPDFKWTTKSADEFQLSNDAKQLNSDSNKLIENNSKIQTFDMEFNAGELVNSYTPMTPSTETSSLSPNSCGYDTKPLENQITTESLPEFRLAPTPAQLGLRRKKAQLKLPNHISHEKKLKNNDSNNVKIALDPPFTERFRDLPQFDFSTYRKANEWDLSPALPTMTYNTNTRKRAHDDQPISTQHKAKRLVGDRFFGPNFNVNQFKDTDGSDLSSASITPNSADDRLQNKSILHKKRRQLIDQRKSLVMELFKKCGFFPSAKDIDDFSKQHSHLFGTKNFLNVKIREYRQKHMHNHSP